MCVFFSSRRLHTRLQGDWSSDVCSSDLIFRAKCVMVQNRNKMVKPLAMALIKLTPRAALSGLSPNNTMNNLPRRMNMGAPGRSEERRVGKKGECERRQDLYSEERPKGQR